MPSMPDEGGAFVVYEIFLSNKIALELPMILKLSEIKQNLKRLEKHLRSATGASTAKTLQRFMRVLRGTLQILLSL